MIGGPAKHEKSNAMLMKTRHMSSTTTSNIWFYPTNSSPVHSTDGTTLLKDKHNILECWAVYLQEVLNRISPLDTSALEELPTLPQVPELDLCPTLEEVHVAIKTLKNKKSPGEDSIPSEVYKYGDHNLSTNPPKFSFSVGNKARSLTLGRMPPLSLSIRGKVTDQTVVTAAASPFLISQEKSLLVSCSIACSIISLTDPPGITSRISATL